MALPGEGGGGTVTLRHQLQWTRTEFSTGSRTKVFESTTIGSLGYEIADISSSTTSYIVTKTMATGDANYTRYYRVKHVLSGGTQSGQSNQVSRVWSALA